MSEITLYPSEEIQVREVYTQLSRKYSQLKDTKQNLLALAEEAERRFRDIGLTVVTDISNQEIDANIS